MKHIKRFKIFEDVEDDENAEVPEGFEYSWNDINLQIYDGGSFEAKDWAYKKLKNEYHETILFVKLIIASSTFPNPL
jgi:hypothetical protein